MLDIMPQKSLAYYENKLRQIALDSTERVIDYARVVSEAETILPPEDFKCLGESLAFSPGRPDQVTIIARNPVIVKNASRLPASPRALLYLARADKQALGMAIANSTISPDSTVAECDHFRDAHPDLTIARGIEKARAPMRKSRTVPLKAKDAKDRIAGVDIKTTPEIWQAFNIKAKRENKSATAKIAELIANEVGGNSTSQSQVLAVTAAEQPLIASIAELIKNKSRADRERLAIKLAQACNCGGGLALFGYMRERYIEEKRAAGEIINL